MQVCIDCTQTRDSAAVHPEAGLRERKKGETRRAIADAALDLATRRGPGAVTVDDIAAAADVSPRTVFNHFPTKEAAILGIDPEQRRELLRALDQRPADEPPVEALRRTLAGFHPSDRLGLWRARARLARSHPPLHAAYVASFAGLEDDLTAAVGRRSGIDPDTDPYPRLVVAVVLTTLRVSLTRAADADAAGDADGDALAVEVERTVDQAFAALAAGLPPPPRP